MDQFNHMFLKILDRHAPFKIVRIRNRRCPFVNMEIKELMGRRDRLLKCASRTGLQVDWSLYRDSRKVVETKVRQAERGYIQKELARTPVLNGK